MSVSDWSANADENTSIDGINIAEHCPAKNINNALRAVMASVKKNDASVVHTADVKTASVTLSDALKAGTSIEVPEHTVGGDGMTVFLCGVLCERGEDAQYLDVDSTHISFNDDLEAGMDIVAVVSFK